MTKHKTQPPLDEWACWKVHAAWQPPCQGGGGTWRHWTLTALLWLQPWLTRIRILWLTLHLQCSETLRLWIALNCSELSEFLKILIDFMSDLAVSWSPCPHGLIKTLSQRWPNLSASKSSKSSKPSDRFKNTCEAHHTETHGFTRIHMVLSLSEYITSASIRFATESWPFHSSTF